MNRWWNGNHKVLKSNSPLIDGLLPALDTMLNQDTNTLLWRSRKEKHEFLTGNMENYCWRKVPLELLCLVDEWFKHIKSHLTHKNLKSLLRKPSTDQSAGTFGPVMLRRMKIIVCNMLWNAIYLSRLLKTKLWTQIVRCSYQTQKKTNQINRSRLFSRRNSTIFNQNNHK